MLHADASALPAHPMDQKAMPAWSQTFTFLDGEWLEGNHPIVGARTHAFWLGTSVFDGARAFEGVTPDLDKHCARLNRSAKAMCLKPTMSVEAMLELTREGMKKFKPGRRTLYPPDVLGRARLAHCPRSRPTRIRPASASASTRRLCLSRPAYRSPDRPTPSRSPSPCRSRPRRAASIPTTRGR